MRDPRITKVDADALVEDVRHIPAVAGDAGRCREDRRFQGHRVPARPVARREKPVTKTRNWASA